MFSPSLLWKSTARVISRALKEKTLQQYKKNRTTGGGAHRRGTSTLTVSREGKIVKRAGGIACTRPPTFSILKGLRTRIISSCGKQAASRRPTTTHTIREIRTYVQSSETPYDEKKKNVLTQNVLLLILILIVWNHLINGCSRGYTGVSGT